MRFRAVCGIRMWRTVSTVEAEDVFGICYDFESPNEQAAKAKCTRLINSESPMQDMTGAAQKGKLPDWWTPDPVKWRQWDKGRREPNEKQPGYIYVQSDRVSWQDFVSFDPKKASATVSAYIQLAWLEKDGDI